jgi:hypothetical protein
VVLQCAGEAHRLSIKTGLSLCIRCTICEATKSEVQSPISSAISGYTTGQAAGQRRGDRAAAPFSLQQRLLNQLRKHMGIVRLLQGCQTA